MMVLPLTPVEDITIVLTLFITRILIRPSKIEMEFIAKIIVFFMSIFLTFLKRWLSAEKHPHIDKIVTELRNITRKKRKLG